MCRPANAFNPLRVYTHAKQKQIRTLKIPSFISELSGLRKHNTIKHAAEATPVSLGYAFGLASAKWIAQQMWVDVYGGILQP